MAEEKGSWGGSRSGAGNPEFKPKWKNGKTTVIRVPEAIADRVLTAAHRIDQGETLDSVTLLRQSDRSQHESVTQSRDKDEVALLKAANKELCQKVGELEVSLFKARQELERVTQERDEYFEQIGEVKLELENLKSELVTQSSSTDLPDPGAILNRLRKEHKNSKANLKDVELIIELLQAIAI